MLRFICAADLVQRSACALWRGSALPRRCCPMGASSIGTLRMLPLTVELGGLPRFGRVAAGTTNATREGGGSGTMQGISTTALPVEPSACRTVYWWEPVRHCKCGTERGTTV